MRKRWTLLPALLLALLLCGCGAKDDHTLHVAAAFHTSELDALVEQFSETHTDCVVEVSYYPENAYDRLCTEIMAGDGPDVLNLFGLSLPPDSSYLEDLYPYIDADGALDRDDFVPTVLSSLEVGGALRSIPATYAVTTLSAGASDVDNAERWTFDEMRDILARQDGDVHLLPESWVQMEFLRWIASISAGTFIDWESRTAHYDSPAFQEQLRFCATLPGSYSYYEADPNWRSLAQLQVIQNPLVLQTISQSYDQPFTFIGFPTEEGSGSFFQCTTLHLGISSASDKKELAWEFIRQALTAEYQRALAERWYLSVRGDIMEAQLQGEIVPLLPEDEENEALDEAVAEQYRRLVSQPLVFIGYNEELSGIILEEGEAYFTGQRTVEEAAERIRNRVTLYLSEIQ